MVEDVVAIDAAVIVVMAVMHVWVLIISSSSSSHKMVSMGTIWLIIVELFQ